MQARESCREISKREPAGSDLCGLLDIGSGPLLDAEELGTENTLTEQLENGFLTRTRTTTTTAKRN
jgi:hypothetical protein